MVVTPYPFAGGATTGGGAPIYTGPAQLGGAVPGCSGAGPNCSNLTAQQISNQSIAYTPTVGTQYGYETSNGGIAYNSNPVVVTPTGNAYDSITGQNLTPDSSGSGVHYPVVGGGVTPGGNAGLGTGTCSFCGSVSSALGSYWWAILAVVLVLVLVFVVH